MSNFSRPFHELTPAQSPSGTTISSGKRRSDPSDAADSFRTKSDPELTPLIMDASPPMTSPPLSPTTIELRRPSSLGPLADEFMLPEPAAKAIIPVFLTGKVTISFTKSNQRFKLLYTSIEVYKSTDGSLYRVQMRDDAYGMLLHIFPNTRRPLPHVERPIDQNKEPVYMVSFLEQQRIIVGKELVEGQAHYTFENRDDFISFQEVMWDQQLEFIAGVGEIKSKRSSEECVSQNIRVFRASNGRRTILFFANSQAVPKKRYIVIPVDSIDHISPAPKASKPVTIKLRPNLEILAELKMLSIYFIDFNEAKRFCSTLSSS